jgi:hypothetical protein
MDLDTLIKRLQILRENHGNLNVMYLVHSDSDQYSIDKVEIVKADAAIEDRNGLPEGTEYVLIKSESVW